jgi:hypothetical protein
VRVAEDYDVIVIDEVEQVLAHFLSETIERQEGGGRDRIFQHLTPRWARP